MRTPSAVIGTAIHAPQEPRRDSLEEAIHATCQAALCDAGLTIQDIDGIAVAANDQLDGRAIAVMMASGPAGGVGREILSTPSAAEHAFVLATLRIATGQVHTQLVVAWSPMEVDSISEALKLGTDPYFHRALPLDEFSAHALQACALEHAVYDAREAALRVVAKNRRHGAIAYPDLVPAPEDKTWAGDGAMKWWPLAAGMVAVPAYGLVALVLADQAFATERGIQRPAWIRGTGWATEPGFLGDRDLAQLPSLAAAAQQAYGGAAIENPAQAFDLAEVADATPHQELLAYEGLRLCPRDEWGAALASGRFDRQNALPVNLSGGALSFNPVFCTGLIRIAEAANQVRGTAGPHQAAAPDLVVAHAASGFAMQYNTVVVFGSKPGALT